MTLLGLQDIITQMEDEQSSLKDGELSLEDQEELAALVETFLEQSGLARLGSKWINKGPRQAA
jgi:hypothetical protein